MLIVPFLTSCSSSTVLDYTNEQAEDQKNETLEENDSCTIEIISHLDSTSPYVQFLITGAVRATIDLSMYEGMESIERTLTLSPSTQNEFEMFWPMETPEHTWQEEYGTQAKITVSGFLDQENEEDCTAEFSDAFSNFDEQLHMYNLISNPQWNVEEAQVHGLLVSVPALHEPDKFALISTPISYTLLKVIGPFPQEDGFSDVTNLTIYETNEGHLHSLIGQEGWPGFEEQIFWTHNAITGELKEKWTLDTSIHHTVSAKEDDDGSLSLTTSVWDERTGFSSGHISFPTSITIDQDQKTEQRSLIDIEQFYPNSLSSPVTYNNFVWPAAHQSSFIGSVIFSNSALSLPPAEENNSSILLYNTQTEEEFWFANADNVEDIHKQADRVVALDPIPDVGLGLVFPHGVQFDGETIYIQDHMDVEAGVRSARINAFDIQGSFLWSYTVPETFESTPNARRRHGGIWSIETEGHTGVCSFFVDTQSTHCVHHDGIQVASMSQKELSPNQGGKWHTVDYLNNWRNYLLPL